MIRLIYEKYHNVSRLMSVINQSSINSAEVQKSIKSAIYCLLLILLGLKVINLTSKSDKKVDSIPEQIIIPIFIQAKQKMEINVFKRDPFFGDDGSISKYFVDIHEYSIVPVTL